MPPGRQTAWTKRAVSSSLRAACCVSRPERTRGLLPPGEAKPITSDFAPSTIPPKAPERIRSSPPPSSADQSTQGGTRSTSAKKARIASGASGTAAIPRASASPSMAQPRSGGSASIAAMAASAGGSTWSR